VLSIQERILVVIKFLVPMLKVLKLKNIIMKIHLIKKILLATLSLVILISCDKEKLTVSNSSYQTTNQTSFPPASGTARVFNFLSQSSYQVSGYTTRSRYVLYDNGAFGLQYSDNGGFEYRGRYTEVNSVITFEWEGWSTAGSWGATATLRGDTLTVAYNIIMMMTDFEDAVYLRKS